MANDVIKLEYPKAEEMQKTFKASAKQLDATIKEMKAIADKLQEGALLGQGGNAYVEALTSKMIPSLTRLKAKYEELDKDVGKAVNAMKQQDAQVARGVR